MAWPVSAEVGRYEEALDWFSKRVPRLRSEIDSMSAFDRRRSFWITGITEARLVQGAQEALLKAQAEGVTLPEFKRLMRGKIGRFRRLPAGRLRTVLTTNSQTSYNDARFAEMSRPERTLIRPNWMFDAVLDSLTTSICRTRDGLIKRYDDPYVHVNQPPLHFNCRSGWRALTAEQAEKQGGLSWDEPRISPDEGFGAAPDVRADDFNVPDDLEVETAGKLVQRVEEMEQETLRELKAEWERQTERTYELPRATTDAIDEAKDWLRTSESLGMSSTQTMDAYIAGIGEGMDAGEGHALATSILINLAMSWGSGIDAVFLHIIQDDAAIEQGLELLKELNIDEAAFAWTHKPGATPLNHFLKRTLTAIFGMTQAVMDAQTVRSVYGYKIFGGEEAARLAAARQSQNEVQIELETAGKWHTTQDTFENDSAYGDDAVVVTDKIDRRRIFLHPNVYDKSDGALVFTPPDKKHTFAPKEIRESRARMHKRATAEINRLQEGVPDRELEYGLAAGYDYPPELDPAMDVYRSADGLVPIKQVQDIARGTARGANGEFVKPVSIVVRVQDDGEVWTAVEDGRDRMRAAIVAGASEVLARVDVFHEAGGAWTLTGGQTTSITIPKGHAGLSAQQLAEIRSRF